MSGALVVIPARMASTRLPDKPLLDIAGQPMIVHVLEQARAADIGPVVVACDDTRIKAAVEAAGGEAVLTDPDLASGSDRVRVAANAVDPDGRFPVVLNLQGDVPLIDPAAIRAAFAPLSDPAVDIGTIATEIRDPALRDDPGAVKTVGTPTGAKRLRALYFTRATAPTGPGPLYQHIGLYAFRRAALEAFVALPPSPLEIRERLEQLRALEAGMRIDVSLIDSVPMDVNTPEDIEAVRAVLTRRGAASRTASALPHS
ncbi:3-deoxy-manno-octulosonate cytidylyltransferase [Stappia taiwanensis]|uniref:3-deoxy-manno-octulosonate cytidylyltransferase n=1 Tax=Stappia taiwanensis TaxID=992267 RepID=A0A838XRE5_9HYPH|nr:3-deoxy-manno-octulosonate cytidylyltransferase [Stappia taiwanensis]MBA4613025.1 3-deoxy-manno-octulosonate cytidylyltransferase [Stappia taiwanensis]GGF01847.1 3-deoxy-manno-octulosonate cytidylyltransferase [Stappia taiwanensis]